MSVLTAGGRNVSETRPCRVAVLVGVLAALPTIAMGLQITPIYVDAAGESWDGDPARQAVIEQAVTFWEGYILEPHTVNVTFTFAAAGSSYLGTWSGSGSVSVGTDIYPWTSGVTHTITFNTDRFTGTNYLWWDPTPLTGDDQPFVAWDALSVCLHELAHALGFTDGFYVDNFARPTEVNRWRGQIVGTTFDPGGLNVAMYQDSLGNMSHVQDAGTTRDDLMVPALVNSERHPIGNIDLEMLSLAHGYAVQLLGDLDGSGEVNNNDISPFVLALTDRAGYQAAYPGIDPDVAGDIDHDGALTNNDITPFVGLLTAGSQPLPEPAAMLLLVTVAPLILRRRRRGR